MSQCANFTHHFHTQSQLLHLQQLPTHLSYKFFTELGSRSAVRKYIGSVKCGHSVCGVVSSKEYPVHKKVRSRDTTKSDSFLYVQTLREFPVEKLFGEVVIVRFDSDLLLRKSNVNTVSFNKALSTIRYLYRAGAKVLLVSNWDVSSDPTLLCTKSFSDYLSSLLSIKVLPANSICVDKELENTDILLLDNLTDFREELTNCSDFSEKLSSGTYIFVNDAFYLSHKILASTVGITRFCHASIAGFQFEQDLLHLSDLKETTRYPYVAIIGGSKFSENALALYELARICDCLVFVGMMGFQIMHASGLSVPSRFLENGASAKAVKLIQLAETSNVSMYFPSDLWCVSDCNRKLESFPCDGIPAGWTPVDVGPMSMRHISSMISECKKILWIGPMKFSSPTRETNGASELALMLKKLSKTDCDVTIVGNAACKAVAETRSPLSGFKVFKSASIVWEFLKGKTLPGVAALDKAYPFDLDWNTMFSDPTQPLVVDIGSGNGMFLLGMAKRWKKSNFLGLEINNKLVKRCLDSVAEADIRNGYFLSTNATSTFRSIISSYPGNLVLVSIQCPDPDFNKETHRWRMIQRTLIESIINLLVSNGEVFLQSDIETVAARMKEQFITYGKGRLIADGWIDHNPFGVHSDWERHVLERGDPMYRVMLRKVANEEISS